MFQIAAVTAFFKACYFRIGILTFRTFILNVGKHVSKIAI